MSEWLGKPRHFYDVSGLDCLTNLTPKHTNVIFYKKMLRRLRSNVNKINDVCQSGLKNQLLKMYVKHMISNNVRQQHVTYSRSYTVLYMVGCLISYCKACTFKSL